MRFPSMLMITGCTLLSVGGLSLMPTPALAQEQRAWEFGVRGIHESTNHVLAITNADGEVENHETSGQWFGVDVQIRNISGRMRSGADIQLGNTVIVDAQGHEYPVASEVSPIVYKGVIIKPVNSGAGETVRLYFNLPPQGIWRKELHFYAGGGEYIAKF
jgi:hypothetical protein